MLDAWLDAVVLLQIGPSLCAGVVVDPGGTVATAYHCVASGLRPMVSFRKGGQRLGRTIGRDPVHDVALVHVDLPDGVPWLPLRDEDPGIGETVYALGHPLGTAMGGKLTHLLQWSAARGMVSAVGPWLIQTDTAMNPGNSGGPLVDEEGRVVGIVSRKLKAEGLGFAAKASQVADLEAAPTMGSVVGGTWGLGLGFFQGADADVGGNVTFAFRERVVARAWLGVGIGDAQPFGLATVEARQRFARGALSTTLDVGGGVRYDGAVAPVLSGRVAVASIGFGALLVPGTWDWTLTFDIEFPGVLGVF
jgi:S1-C subfamily serine protease